ncbi:MAG: dockerin type I domain-containing protein, partial [Dehalococcoidia bacterium]|nr:dockerin type I domain-containing protein [Dehalococcoidia bacterium]
PPFGASANNIVMSFVGEKEGADLNGDGFVNILDLSKFADQWLQAGSLEADFNQDSTVDFADLSRVAESWRWQAIWYHD